MSNHYPPQGMPQSQPFGQPQFAQQPPAGFPPPGPGVPLRPHGPGLANNKRFLVAGLLGAGVILSLLVLFLPYLTASGGRKKTATLSDVADGFKDPSFVLVLIATIAAAAALVPLFLDYRRVPPALLFVSGGVPLVSAGIDAIFWFRHLGKVNDVNDVAKKYSGYGGSSSSAISFGIGFWFLLVATILLIVAGVLAIIFAATAPKPRNSFSPNFGAPRDGGPATGYTPRPGYGPSAPSAPGAQPGYGYPGQAPGQPGYGPSAPSAPGAQPGYGPGQPRYSSSAPSAPAPGAQPGYGHPGQAPGAGPATPGQPSATGYVSPITPNNPDQYPRQ